MPLPTPNLGIVYLEENQHQPHVPVNDAFDIIDAAVGDLMAFAEDGDKGDIVVSGSGTSWQIDAGAVGSTELANDAVTYAKMQNVSATDKLLGRSTAGAGDVEEIACTAAGRALIDDADASAQRTTLGLGTAAVLASDTDATLAANSDTRLATQKAVKTYVDGITAANDAMIFMGVIDCSANPNYPAADRGHTYRVSVAGKIGGGSGTNVEAGDILICLTDSTASGTQAGVGASWSIAQANLDGAVIGPSSAVDGALARFNGTTGKLIKATPATIATGDIDADAVTFAKMQNLATDRLMGRDTAGSGDPEEISVGGGLEFSGAAGIQRSALTGDVTAAAGSNATTIANDAVTYAKMQNVSATSRVLGRKTAGAGDTEEVTLSELLDFIGAAAQGDILYRGGASWARLGAGTAGQKLKTGGAGANPAWADDIANVTFILDGGGSAITNGVKLDIVVDFACVIVGHTLIADQSGSIVIDLWKDTYANYPPTVADTITASAKPTLSAATKAQDTTLTGWTTTVNAGDIIRLNVDSASTVTRVTLALKVRKT